MDNPSYLMPSFSHDGVIETDDYVEYTASSRSASKLDALAFDSDNIHISLLGNISEEWSSWREGDGKVFTILRSFSAIVSVTASLIFIWMLLRSHTGLSSTYHRLLLGLCISDILFSFSYSFFNRLLPSDLEYGVWNAKGNMHTCNLQGFLATFGCVCGVFYNTSLSLYYLAVVKYDKTNDYIRKKLEPWFHSLPISIAIGSIIWAFSGEHFNADMMGYCHIPIYEPPHCRDIEDGLPPHVDNDAIISENKVDHDFKIPCGRGRIGGIFLRNARFIVIFGPLIAIIVCLCLIHRAVLKQEKRQSKYGVAALRASILGRSLTDGDMGEEDGNDLNRSVKARAMQRIKGRFGSLRSSANTSSALRLSSTSNIGARLPSRAIMNRALAYALAWMLTWLWTIVISLIHAADKGANTGGSESIGFYGQIPLAIYYLDSICHPLQGVYNLSIFMYPRIIAAKRGCSRRRGRRRRRSSVVIGGNDNSDTKPIVTWSNAFLIAFWSKGTTDEVVVRRARRPSLRSRHKKNAREFLRQFTFGQKMNGNNRRKERIRRQLSKLSSHALEAEEGCGKPQDHHEPNHTYATRENWDVINSSEVVDHSKPLQIEVDTDMKEMRASSFITSSDDDDENILTDVAEAAALSRT